jgi:hypothetical protein
MTLARSPATRSRRPGPASCPDPHPPRRRLFRWRGELHGRALVQRSSARVRPADARDQGSDASRHREKSREPPRRAGLGDERRRAERRGWARGVRKPRSTRPVSCRGPPGQDSSAGVSRPPRARESRRMRGKVEGREWGHRRLSPRLPKARNPRGPPCRSGRGCCSGYETGLSRASSANRTRPLTWGRPGPGRQVVWPVRRTQRRRGLAPARCSSVGWRAMSPTPGRPALSGGPPRPVSERTSTRHRRGHRLREGRTTRRRRDRSAPRLPSCSRRSSRRWRRATSAASAGLADRQCRPAGPPHQPR